MRCARASFVLLVGCTAQTSSESAQTPAAPRAAEPAEAPTPSPVVVEPVAPVAPVAPVDPVAVPPDPTGLTPPPVDDVELAALPLDVRTASVTALLTTHRKDCKAFARKSPCELKADLDGDGKKDRAFKIRDRATRHAGIAIAWADGSASIVGAGARTRQLSTDVHMEGIDLSWREATEDFADDDEVDSAWGIAPRDGDGFRHRVMRTPTVHAAPGRTGDGIWIDGGDAVEILYWDGTRWRWLILGF